MIVVCDGQRALDELRERAFLRFPSDDVSVSAPFILPGSCSVCSRWKPSWALGDSSTDMTSALDCADVLTLQEDVGSLLNKELDRRHFIE
jgi:hypothetical protein